MMPFSDEDLKPVVKKTLLTKVVPILAKYQGSIELIDVKDAKIYVSLTGACGSCPASANTLKFIVQKALRDQIHPELEVISAKPNKKNKS